MDQHQDPVQNASHPREALSEVQLRQLYDEEEVERVMSLFSAYVTEVRLSTNTASTESTNSYVEHGLDAPAGSRTPPLLYRLPDCSLSEHVAYNYVMPHLPPATNTTPAFSLKRFSLTIQRLYLAMFPPYYALFSGLVRLAMWEDHQRSLRYCIIFWFLWIHDLLLPALVFRIVFGLLRRRLSTYPTLKELQERRQETEQALRFGEAVQERLSVTTIGPTEIWRLFKLYKSEEKEKAKFIVKDTVETDGEEALKRDILFALNELVDLHERVKNIFTWRRSYVSRRYLLVLIIVGFGTLILPAKWIAKLVYCCGGILFWHITPVVAALPPMHRKRLVSFLFRDSPTDADYAMELIAERIATGQDVDVASLRNQPRLAESSTLSTDNLTHTSYNTLRDVHLSEDDRIDWKKWTGRVARGKLIVEEGRHILSSHTSQNQASEETSSIYRAQVGTEDAHTYLAQYASIPGMITLTPSTLFFTSLTGSHARLVIPRDRLRGVRKSGLMKGIAITWAQGELMEQEEREEKFHWVGSRDELFARLIGSDGGRWTTV